MKWKGTPIQRVRVPRSGVTIESAEFEWREVARAYHVTYQQFIELPVREQASMIAHHRLTNQIQAVLAKDANEKQGRARNKTRR